MKSDKRLLLTLQRALLGLALSASISLSGCAETADADSDRQARESEAARTGDPSLLDEKFDETALVENVEEVSGEVEASDATPDTQFQVTGPAPTEQSASRAGPYRVQRYTNGYRNGPNFADGTMHYPSDAEGPFASIAIVPGFDSPQSSNQTWGPFLASHGIVAFTIGTNSGFDQPPARARALLDAVETIRGENTRSNSPLRNKLDLTRIAIGGWSMGGGGTLQAANATPSFKAAMVLAGWDPGGRYTRNTVPTIFFAGTSDPLAGGQSQGHYRSIPESTPKLLWEVRGAGHNVGNNPAGQGGAIGRYGLSFLKVFLEGDDRYKQFLTATPPGRPATYTTNIR